MVAKHAQPELTFADALCGTKCRYPVKEALLSTVHHTPTMGDVSPVGKRKLPPCEPGSNGANYPQMKKSERTHKTPLQMRLAELMEKKNLSMAEASRQIRHGRIGDQSRDEWPQ